MSAQDYENKNPGGFINPKHSTPRIQKMKWTAEADRRLLIIGLGKEISPKEYAPIAASFKEKPTAKAVQERLTKLRQEQQDVLENIGLVGASTKIHPYKADDDQESSLASNEADFGAEDAARVLMSLASGESPTVSGSTTYKKKKKQKRTATQTTATRSLSSIPDPDDELLPLEMLHPPLTEEEKRERRHEEARRNYARQMEKEKGVEGVEGVEK